MYYAQLGYELVIPGKLGANCLPHVSWPPVVSSPWPIKHVCDGRTDGHERPASAQGWRVSLHRAQLVGNSQRRAEQKTDSRRPCWSAGKACGPLVLVKVTKQPPKHKRKFVAIAGL